MELTPLRYYVAICREGHMTRAARALGVSQSALSSMLAKLETEVGAALLHRTGRGVEMTDAGRAFLAHAEEALRAADRGVRAVRELLGLQRGSIRVGGGATATAFLFPPVVSAFRREHPGVTFYVREAGSAAVAGAVLSGELDLGIVTLPLTRGSSDGLESRDLVEDELRLIVPPRDTLGRGTRGFAWRDLEDRPVVAFEAGTAVRAMIDDAARAAGVQLRVVMELRSIEGIKRMVAAGIGVGFVSRFALRENEGLACRDGRLTRRLAVVHRADRGADVSARAIAAMLEARWGRRRTEATPRQRR